ncbi:hypothetical protein ACLETV_23305 [Citrobacter braakii]|uniref:hypothetical protein n=1 Tax=Citrobacter braakii TaxID=57706 RepID=UPI0039765BF5
MQLLQLVAACSEGDLPIGEVCRSFKISRKTGYNWLARFSPDEPSRSLPVPGNAILRTSHLNLE